MTTTREKIKHITEEIFNISCPILDIGKRFGHTGYIDFIDSDDFKEEFNKGIDMFGRKFIALRAIIEYTNGEIIETFMTLFQRYVQDDSLWVGAGSHLHLFSTQGGADLQQLQLVLKLLKDKTVDVTEEIYKNCRIHSFYYNRLNENIPKRIYLVSNKTE
jgi:hypothetical protein